MLEVCGVAVRVCFGEAIVEVSVSPCVLATRTLYALSVRVVVWCGVVWCARTGCMVTISELVVLPRWHQHCGS